MRLKVAPGDFRVRETLDYVEDREGPYFIHRLRKEKLDTLEAIRIVAAEARVDRAKIAFAGLKDRQGVTEQWISIEGARIDYRGRGIDVRFFGRSAEPLTSKLSHGNEFALIVRDLDRSELATFEARLPEVRRSGFANYFDDQRFACLKHEQGFVMREVLRGRYEKALRDLIAKPSPRAITGDVALKRALAHAWGDWERCKSIARGPIWRRLFEHLLKRPGDFGGALELLPSRQKLIHAFAYQSYLWNRGVDLFLKRQVPSADQLVIRTRAGHHASWRTLEAPARAALEKAQTPLCGGDGPAGDPDFASAMGRVFRDAHLDAESFRSHVISGMVLREEPRDLVCRPRKLVVQGPERDERHRGHHKLELRFGLPRGAYATMLVKHLFPSDQSARFGGRDFTDEDE
jgi:tRNA pseudouridine13 synthase